MVLRRVLFGRLRLRVRLFMFFFKQKTAYEIFTDWSSDVCSSDLAGQRRQPVGAVDQHQQAEWQQDESQVLPGVKAGVGQIGRASCRERVLRSLVEGAVKEKL